MAKNFYGIDEVTAKLGMNADQVKALVRDAKLREFRDGPKIHYKKTEVDKLSAKLGATADAASASGGSGELVLEPLDESPSAGSGSGTGIPMGSGDASGSGTGLLSLDDSDAAPADEIKLDDSALPEPGKDDTVITADGVSVFDEEDLEGML